MAKILRKIKVPRLSAYVILGILVGPYCLNWINLETLNSLRYITDFGLGMIAFMIGMEFHRSSLKGIKKIFFITVFESLFTAGLIFSALYFTNLLPFKLALIIGVIGAATAPGPIILFVKNNNIKRCKLKNLLLPVIALDDAVAVILYAFALNILVSPTSTISLAGVMVVATHIIISLGIGIAIGLILALLKRVEDGQEQYLTYSIAAIAAGIALSAYFNASYIISLITAGFVFTNFINKESYFTQDKSLTNFNPPIFMMFYTIAGALLPINQIGNFIWVILIYIVVRIIGKIAGFFISSSLCKIDKNVSKYIGLAALPQAGVAIGLTTSIPEPFRTQVMPIIIGAVFFFQLTGSALVELSFRKAGNYDPKNVSNKSNDKKDYHSSVAGTYHQSSENNIFKTILEKWNTKNKK